MLARSLRIAPLVFAVVIAGTAHAQLGADAVKGLLGQASDAALDKLSKPGAFSADDAVRITLPGLGGNVGKNLGALGQLANQAGIGGDLSGSVNRAAEQAAGRAKPIFRSAIDRASLGDAVSAARGGDTGATDYLKKSSNDQIVAQLKPLIAAALEKAGVTKQASQLSAIGMDGGKLTDYVSQKTADGIFTYMGREETTVRRDPVGQGKALLKGMKF